MTDMFRHDNRDPAELPIPDDVQDISFRIEAGALPMDHAGSLSEAVVRELPWLSELDKAGIHPVNYPESGGGWMAENGGSEIFFASKRLRLRLRLPKQYVQRAYSLSGRRLDIDKHTLMIGPAKTLPLANASTLFSRRVIMQADENEQRFSDRMIGELARIGISAREILCGKEKQILRHKDILSVRSVMLADLEFGESIRLQQHGLGPGRLLGCGIFIPHKNIAPAVP